MNGTSKMYLTAQERSPAPTAEEQGDAPRPGIHSSNFWLSFWRSNRFGLLATVLGLVVSLSGAIYVIATDLFFRADGPEFLFGAVVGLVLASGYALYQYDNFLLLRHFEEAAEEAAKEQERRNQQRQSRQLQVTARVKTESHHPEVQLHYRLQSHGEFSSVIMKPQQDDLFAAVVTAEEAPVVGVGDGIIQYYVSVHVDGQRQKDAASELRATPAPTIAPPAPQDSSAPAPPA